MNFVSILLQKVFERFLQATLDYNGRQEQEIVWQVACCVALLPQIGGGGVGGVQYKCAWAAQQKILCRTAHLILDELYDNSNELQVIYIFLFWKYTLWHGS